MQAIFCESLASAGLYIGNLVGMDTDELRDLRVQRLRWLRNDAPQYKDLQQQAFAKLLGTSPSQLGQWLSGHRRISEDSARKIEKATGRPKGWLDGDIQGNTPEASPKAKRIGREFDKIEDPHRQNEAFTEILEVIERFSTAPVPGSSESGQTAKSARRVTS